MNGISVKLTWASPAASALQPTYTLAWCRSIRQLLLCGLWLCRMLTQQHSPAYHVQNKQPRRAPREARLQPHHRTCNNHDRARQSRSTCPEPVLAPLSPVRGPRWATCAIKGAPAAALGDVRVTASSTKMSTSDTDTIPVDLSHRSTYAGKTFTREVRRCSAGSSKQLSFNYKQWVGWKSPALAILDLTSNGRRKKMRFRRRVEVHHCCAAQGKHPQSAKMRRQAQPKKRFSRSTLKSAGPRQVRRVWRSCCCKKTKHWT